MRSMIFSLLFWVGMLCAFGTPAARADAMADAIQHIGDGEDVQAASLLESWADTHANDYEALFMLGEVYAHQRKYRKAIEMFRRVSILRPKLAEPHSDLALVYNEIGDIRAAVRELEIFLHKKPEDSVIQENLGDLHVRLALRNYQAALARTPDRSLYAKYQQLLQLGQLSPVIDDHVVGLDKVSELIVEPAMASVKTRIAIAGTPPVETVKEDTSAVPSKLIWDNPTVSSEAEEKKEIPVISGVSSASDSLKTPVYIHAGNQPEGMQVIGNTPVDKDVMDVVEAWRLAWSRQDILGYFAMYADNFMPLYQNTSQTLNVWKEYKKRVISKRRYIHIILKDLSVEMLDHDHRARVQFRQTFDSDSYHSQDNKELMFVKQSNGWKIIQERKIGFFANDSQGVIVIPDTNQAATPKPKDTRIAVTKKPANQVVLDAVEAWRTAWVAKDIPGYFHAYSDHFTPSKKSRTLTSWKQYKKRMISEKTYIHITLNNMYVEMMNKGRRAIVQFQQVFTSNSYVSWDDKELIFAKQVDGWKIVQEKVL